jgi:adenylate cyclase
VVEYGGEVLRFIGDAVLAIFPLLDDPDSPHQQACADAINAALEAERRMAALNIDRAAEGLEPLGFGIGLHLGSLTYGNIGIPERLEFTVIGAAANEAARIESLTKELGENILISESFSEHCPSPLDSKGRHKLRGVSAEQEIFVHSGTEF